MKFIFVIPRYTVVGDYYSPPIGMGYVISALKDSGYSVECINMNETGDSISYSLGRFNPKECVVLTGGLSAHYNQISSIIKIANSLEFCTVLGGGILTAEPEVVYGFISPTYGIVGEADTSIVELAEALSTSESPMIKKYRVESIAGIVFRKDDGSVCVRVGRNRIVDIDRTPTPDYDAIGLPSLLKMMNGVHEPYFQGTDSPRMVPVVTSRGCPFKCSFCFSPIGKQYVGMSMDAIFSQVDSLMDRYHPNMFMFLDELFSIKPEHLKVFCERIKIHNVNWLCQLRVNGVDEEALAMMHDAGCVCVSWGIESISDKVLARMHKQTTRADIEKTMDMAYRNKIGIQGNFIFGTPGETSETWRETVEWWKSNRRYMINLSHASTYPGSEMYKIAVEGGKIPDKEAFLRNGCPTVNITDMSDEEHGLMLSTIHALQHEPSPFICRNVAVSQDGVNTVQLEYDCPHCGGHLKYRNIKKGFDSGRKTLRYACRICNQRADFPFAF